MALPMTLVMLFITCSLLWTWMTGKTTGYVDWGNSFLNSRLSIIASICQWCVLTASCISPQIDKVMSLLSVCEAIKSCQSIRNLTCVTDLTHSLQTVNRVLISYVYNDTGIFCSYIYAYFVALGQFKCQPAGTCQ